MKYKKVQKPIKRKSLTYGSTIAPFNRKSHHYYLAEKDPHLQENDVSGELEKCAAHLYRRLLPQEVTLSTNDRAPQLKLAADLLTMTGDAGYCVARATHSIMYGKWYYEVELIEQPPGSHTRIGWAQSDGK